MTKKPAKEWAEELDGRLGDDRRKLEILTGRRTTYEYRITIWNKLLALLQDHPPQLPAQKLRDCLNRVTQQIGKLSQQRETWEKRERELKQELANSTNFILRGLLLQLVKEDLAK